MDIDIIQVMASGERYRRCWSKDETRALLNCYAKHKADFDRPRKKKFGYEKLLAELNSMGVLEEKTTAEMIESRIKSLKKAYKDGFRNSRRYAPCVMPFLREMEDIFGNPFLAKQGIKLKETSTESPDDSTTSYEYVVEFADSSPEPKLNTSSTQSKFASSSPSVAASTLHPPSSFDPASSARPTCETNETPDVKFNLGQWRRATKFAMAERKHEQRQQLLQMIQQHLKDTDAAMERRHRETLALIKKKHREKLALIERRHREKFALIERLFQKKRKRKLYR